MSTPQSSLPLSSLQATPTISTQEIVRRRRFNGDRVRLPAELWTEIAVFHRANVLKDVDESLQNDGPLAHLYDYIYLSHVCFFIRQTLINYGRLWDVVISTPTTSVELVEEFRRRSKSYKMDVGVVVNPITPQNLRLTDHLARLLPYASRVEVYLTSRAKQEQQPPKVLLPTILSGLQTMVVRRPAYWYRERARDIPYDLEQFDSFSLPNVRNLTIYNCRLDPSFPRGACDQLTSLNITHKPNTHGLPKMYLSQVIQTLKRLKNLELLRLDSALMTTDTALGERQYISLPHLTTMIIVNGGWVSAHLLWHLVVPPTALIQLIIPSVLDVEQLENVMGLIDEHFQGSPRSFHLLCIHRDDGLIAVTGYSEKESSGGPGSPLRPSFSFRFPDGVDMPLALFTSLHHLLLFDVETIILDGSLVLQVPTDHLKMVLSPAKNLKTVQLANIIPPTETYPLTSDAIVKVLNNNPYLAYYAQSYAGDPRVFAGAREIIDRVLFPWTELRYVLCA